MSTSAPSPLSSMLSPTPATAGRPTPDASRDYAGRKELSEVERTKIAAQAAVSIRKSFQAAAKEARGATRTRVKETVDRLKKELSMIKKVWAGDPKELARQVSRIAKALKSAMADYAQAAKENGESVGNLDTSFDAAPPPSAASPDQADTNSDNPDGEAAKSDGATDAAPPIDADTARALAAYGRVAAGDDVVQAKADAEMEARGDLDFGREVRAFVRALRDVLQESKTRHAFNTRDREGQLKAEEDAGKALGEVDKAAQDLDRDVRADFPGLTIAQTPAAG